MMAMVSEVSMNQANALKLQQSLKERESELEQCYIRMEKGEPPSEEIDRDWLKYLRDDDRRAYENEEKRLVCCLNFIYFFSYFKCGPLLFILFADHFSIPIQLTNKFLKPSYLKKY